MRTQRSQAGVASSPGVDGERLYYVNNRWELVCADVAGDAGKAKIALEARHD